MAGPIPDLLAGPGCSTIFRTALSSTMWRTVSFAASSPLFATLLRLPWSLRFHEIQPLPQLEKGSAPAQTISVDRLDSANRPNWLYRGIDHDGAIFSSS
jgi:hypothetical protein